MLCRREVAKAKGWLPLKSEGAVKKKFEKKTKKNKTMPAWRILGWHLSSARVWRDRSRLPGHGFDSFLDALIRGRCTSIARARGLLRGRFPADLASSLENVCAAEQDCWAGRSGQDATTITGSALARRSERTESDERTCELAGERILGSDAPKTARK